MLIKSKDLKGFKLMATDGAIGKVAQFFFDDRHWTIRYLVADTGSWLTNLKVLLDPYALKSVDRDLKTVQLNRTKKQILLSPTLASDLPVSEQYEEAYYGYYGWPRYWSGNHPWGETPYIVNEIRDIRSTHERHGDPHLRSTHELEGYQMLALDGEIGHVKDFIIDDQTWVIRYLVVDTGHWLTSRKVLVSTRWIENVSWVESKVSILLSKEDIRTSPQYSEGALSNSAYETDLHETYIPTCSKKHPQEQRPTTPPKN
jgi:uncharacterized protein YrrD